MSRPAEKSISRDPDPAPTACFFVSGDATPGFASRVLELFAKRNIVPDEFHARTDGGRQSIEVRVHGVESALAAYIGRCLRQIVSAERVLVSEESDRDGA